MSELTGRDTGGHAALGEEDGGLSSGVAGESLAAGLLDGGLGGRVGIDTRQHGEGAQSGPKYK